MYILIKMILTFFKEYNILLPVPQLEDLKLQDSEEYSSGEEEWGLNHNRHSNKKQSSNQTNPSPKTSKHAIKELIRSNSDYSDLVGPVPHSASLQRRTSYNEMRQQQLDRLKKAGALGLLDREIALKSAGSVGFHYRYDSVKSPYFWCIGI